MIASGNAQRFQLSMQRRTFHTDKLGRARHISAEPVNLGDQIFTLEPLARLAQRQRHYVPRAGDGFADIRFLNNFIRQHLNGQHIALSGYTIQHHMFDAIA